MGLGIRRRHALPQLAKRFRQPNPMSRGGHNWKGGGTVEGSRSWHVMKLARAGYLAGSRTGGWQWTYRDGTDGLHRDHRWQDSHHPRLSHQVGRRGMAVGPPARADPLDALPLRRRAALVRLRRSRQWGVLRPTGCQALRCRSAVCLPPLLPPRICDPARRADGPSPPSPCAPASAPRRGLRRAGRNAATGARSGCGSERMIASCSRSRRARSAWMSSSWSARSGYLPGSTNRNSAEGCDDERRAVTAVTLVPNGSYGTTRFNALRHGVLSRYTVLPWEDRDRVSEPARRFGGGACAGWADRRAPRRGAGWDHLAEAPAADGRGGRVSGEAPSRCRRL